jgi:dipeptidase
LHLEWPYHNAFLVADPASAWILETSARHWVATPVGDVANISNGLATGTEWTRGARDVTSFAVERGWWAADAGRVDFARAYNDDATMPPNVCAARRRRGAALLAEARGQTTAAALRALLRDHYGRPAHPRPAFDDPQYFSICMHAEPLDNTVASMVMELPGDADAIVRGWVSFGSPCVGTFLPCYPDAPLPSRLGRGGAAPDAESPWWRTRALLELVERDPARRVPLVRSRFDALEAALAAEAADVEAAAGHAPDRSARLAAFMERAVDAWLAELDATLAVLRAA